MMCGHHRPDFLTDDGTRPFSAERARIGTVVDPLVLVLAASSRTGSFNVMLSKLAIDALQRQGAKVDTVAYKDVVAPNYDADEEKASGIPEQVRNWAERLEHAQAFLIVSPEYNASVPGSLKNLIDWMSRLRPQPFWGHHGMLMSVSPRYNGGNRGLWALRVPLEHLGAHVYPEMFSVPNADDVFTPQGEFANPKNAGKLDRAVEGFLTLVRKVRA
jgi:NAD(P)H-dependent FMN reductase